ncbi:hypothetical protein NMY22_g834 [Coprinellus aureogranulatus]|nr:hypothetical protein NMY22_g834 [Coprinellus aureogranulatus]
MDVGEPKAVSREERHWPTVRRTKTGDFAQLATVNRAFYHASTDIIWETMDDLVPLFGHLLQADENEHGHPSLPLSYEGWGVTETSWKKFEFYASKTKYLVLEKPPSRIMDVGWLSYLIHSTGRPSALFPTICDLIVKAAEPLFLFVASNSFPALREFGLQIGGAWHEYGPALTKGLSQHAKSLCFLKISQPATSSLLHAISRITSLTCLHITIGEDVESLGLSQLTRLPALGELQIVQNHNPHSRPMARRLPDVVESPLQGSTMANLGSLKVTANGATQYLVASILAPQNLYDLLLELLPDALNIQMLLLPSTLSLYASRNHALKYLEITTPYTEHFFYADPQSLSSLTTDLRYRNIDPFLTYLAALHEVEVLVIDVPFLAPDVLIRLHEVALALPNLKQLSIESWHLSEDEKLLLPSLPTLEEISTSLPHLYSLTMLATLMDVPSPPVDCTSTAPRHELQYLQISTPEEEPIEDMTAEQKVNLAVYIDTLFPQADTGRWDEGTREDIFWSSVQESFDSYRNGLLPAV